MSRDYVEVRFPKELIRPYPKVLYSYPLPVTYGFGASRVTGHLKVVRIYHDAVRETGSQSRTRIIPESECHVHTLGTGSWRRVEPCARHEYPYRTSCVFLNGNLHWMVSDSDSHLCISCFDLETERFSTLSTPPTHQGIIEADLIPGLSVLGDCLCLCHHTREEDTVIWLMKEYGDEKSWIKEYVININYELDIQGFELVYPIKGFQDGDILMSREDYHLFYYSNKTRTAQDIGGMFEADYGNSILLTPSLLSLRSLGMENVISF